jgi:hypothetical protein
MFKAACQNKRTKQRRCLQNYCLRLSGPVLYPPLVGLPHGVWDTLPKDPLLLLRPSPPPWGWSTGFIATPLTVGLRPNHRLCPAFLSFRSLWLGFETMPIVARHLESIFFTTPEGSCTTVMVGDGSFRIFALVPAARTILPPWPGFNSMLCIIVPIRIAPRGMQLPICELISRCRSCFIMSPRSELAFPATSIVRKKKLSHLC